MNIKTLIGIYDSNTYIIDAPKGIIIIDCGTEFEHIEKVLQKCQKPVSLLLTHGHIDHIYSAAKLQQHGATVFIHDGDAERLYTDKHEGGRRGYVVEFCKPDKSYDEGEVLNLAGLSIKVLHTPGHTEGSVCFIVEDKIFTGDTLFFEDYGRTDLYGGDHSKIKKSLFRLFDLDQKLTVYSGHYRTSTIGHEKKCNPINNN
ncbi:MAG: MBL fold metallo-hydrolase [Clostridiales bacterium]|jgi:glyoxylase-like metal-dependent hydrolase (beta-lactamase superfamily II)|nr:MBL fold metallo-hydrolase [Clostridiales bacterium]